MNKYNFVFLNKDDKDLKELKEFVSSLSCKIVSEKDYGRKKLAYPIKKQGIADLHEWIIEIENDKISEFKKKLGFNDKILRYLIIKLEVKSEKSKIAKK